MARKEEGEGCMGLWNNNSTQFVQQEVIMRRKPMMGAPKKITFLRHFSKYSLYKSEPSYVLGIYR